jgi:plastocyanin
MRNIYIIGTLAVLLAGGIYYTATKDKNETGQPDLSPTANAREISVEAGDVYFLPVRIRAEAGETLRIKLTNQGNWRHDFVIDELNAKSEVLRGGESTEFEFMAGEKGIYTYYCSVPGHRAMGQIGHLIVGDFEESELDELIRQKMELDGDKTIGLPGN